MECLLNWYPIDHVLKQDKHGLRAMDYLLWNGSITAVSLIKILLRKTIITTISSWKGAGAKWASALISKLELIERDDSTRKKIQHLHDFLGHAGYYVRLEKTSLLELALWKWRMEMVRSDAGEGGHPNNDYRADCRCQCGADVVIENVADFLWFDKSRACTALRLCPLSTMVFQSEVAIDLEDADGHDTSAPAMDV